MEMDYKSNSHRSKEDQPEETRPKVEKVVTSEVRTKKKTGFNKFADEFISEDAKNVKSYIVTDVLIPAVKKTISDIITNGIDMLLYGGKGSGSRSGSASKVSYRSYYDSGRRDSLPSVRSSYSYDDVVIANRGEAEDVLTRMDELLSRYGVVSVADFYDLVGVQCSYTDNRYGWSDLRMASVVRVRDGYQIKLPRAMPLD